MFCKPIKNYFNYYHQLNWNDWIETVIQLARTHSHDCGETDAAWSSSHHRIETLRRCIPYAHPADVSPRPHVHVQQNKPDIRPSHHRWWCNMILHVVPSSANGAACRPGSLVDSRPASFHTQMDAICNCVHYRRAKSQREQFVPSLLQ